MTDRMLTLMFGLQVTIFGGILAFAASTSAVIVIGVALLGVIISAVGLLKRRT